jgi:hypothetical protein
MKLLKIIKEYFMRKKLIEAKKEEIRLKLVERLNADKEFKSRMIVIK